MKRSVKGILFKICFYGGSKNRSFKKEENFFESVSIKKQQLHLLGTSKVL